MAWCGPKRWPDKDPNAVKPYTFDWTWRLYNTDELSLAQAQDDAGQTVTIVPADKVTASTFAISPVGGTLVQAVGKPSTFTDTETQVWLQDGDELAEYQITNHVTMQSGIVDDWTVTLKVKSQ